MQVTIFQINEQKAFSAKPSRDRKKGIKMIFKFMVPRIVNLY